MKNDFIKEGNWSIHKDLKNPWYGKLVYSKTDGLVLKLTGNFDISHFYKMKYQIMYGLLFDRNKKVTLRDCFVVKCEEHYLDFKVNEAFIGDFLEFPIEDIIWARIDYFGLKYYFIDCTGLYLGDKFNASELTIHYKQFPDIEIPIEDDKIVFRHYLDLNSSNVTSVTDYKEINLKESVSVLYYFVNNTDFSNLQLQSRLLSMLLNLLCGLVIYQNGFSFKTSQGKNINYYYENRYFKKKYKINSDVNFEHDKIEFEPIIQRWFGMKDELKKFIRFFDNSDLNYNSYDEHRFLESLIALETYYKNIYEGAKKEFLIDFYKDLYNQLPCNFQKSVNNDISTYCRYLRDTRNYYTHNDHNKKYVLSSENLIFATSNNEALIRYLLLRYIGIEEDQISIVLSRKFLSVTLNEPKVVNNS